jgi:hypothetical protein
MMPLKNQVCVIDKQMRDNYLALFVELIEAANTKTLTSWTEENRFLIEQSITELETVDIEYA